MKGRNRLLSTLPAALLSAFALVFTIAVLVGWSVIFTRYYAVGSRTGAESFGVGYWILLSIGCVFLVIVIGALVYLLVSNIQRTRVVRQQTAFIDAVTHELRSPLASLMLAIDTMEQRKLTEEQRARFIANMRDDVDRLQGLVEHALEVARLEHGDREIDFRAFVLVELIDECADTVRRRYRLGADKLRVEVDDTIRSGAEGGEPLRIESAPVALQTVLLNLLDNAVKYSPSGVDVQLHAQHRDERLTISVSDKGLGIPAKQLKQVFRRFHRVPRSDAPTVGGTGLGLYLARELVEQLGGELSVESDGDHQGSCFTLSLPTRTTVAARPAATSQAPQHGAASATSAVADGS